MKPSFGEGGPTGLQGVSKDSREGGMAGAECGEQQTVTASGAYRGGLFLSRDNTQPPTNRAPFCLVQGFPRVRKGARQASMPDAW